MRPTRHAVILAVLLVAAACADDAGEVSTVPASPATTRAPTTFTATTLDPISTTSTRPSTTTTAPPAVAPRRGGTVVVAQRPEPASLNPLVDGSAAARRLAALHMVGISDVGPDGRRFPEILTQLPTLANGGLEVDVDGTMTVRYEILPEAVWADGTPISGRDLRFTYEALRDLEGYTPGFGADADLYDQILPESVVAGDKTFEFAMVRPTVQHELLFDVVLPQHRVAGTDLLADWNDVPWTAGGPFVLEAWEPGVAARFVRNEAYWKADEDGAALPYLDAVEIRFFADSNRLVDAFRVEDAEVAAPPGAVGVIDALAELTPEGVAVYALPGAAWEQLSFQFGVRNRNPGSLNADVRFRRAVAHAVDRDALAAEILGGYGRAMDSYVEVYRPEVSEGAWSRYDHDPGEARRLISEVCDERGLPCEADPPVVVMTTSADSDLRMRLSELVAPMLADAGLGVRVELEAGALLFGETLLAGTWDVGVWAWEAGPGLAPLVEAHDLWDPGGAPPYGTNYQRWGTGAVEGSEPVASSSGAVNLDQPASPVADEHTVRFALLRDRMGEIVDEQALLAVVAEAETLLADQVVFVPLFARLWVGAVWADRVGGYVPNPANDLWNVERWYRLDLPEEGAGVVPGEG